MCNTDLEHDKRCKFGPGLVLVLLGLAVCLESFAMTLQTDDDHRLQQQEANLTLPHRPEQQIEQMPESSIFYGTLEVDEQDLIANPKLLSRALLSALVSDNAEHVQMLLPIYNKQTVTNIESDMLIWAEAVIASDQKRLLTAIKYYQTLADKYPHQALFEVRLAQALFANRQYAQALTLFEAQEEQIQHELKPYLDAIKQLKKLRMNFNANLIDDKNINNAPNNRDLGGGWTADEPQASRGISASMEIYKPYLLSDGAEFRPQLSMQTKRYQDAKHYNEMSVRASANIGIHNYHHSLSMTPFYERVYYAGGQKSQSKMRYFSHQVGLSADYDWRATNKTTLSLSAQMTQNHHQVRKHLEGHSFRITPSITLMGRDWLTWLAPDYQHTHTQDKDDSFKRYGVNGSAIKQWGDLGVQGSVGLARREYQAPMPIFNRTQINREFYVNASIWHDKIRYKHFVPRLSYHYQKTKSNIGLYSYDKDGWFIEVTGRF